MDGTLKPHQESVVSVGTPALDDDSFIKKHEFKTGPFRILGPFAQEYAFFTPAILYLYGGFRDAPLADLAYMTGIETKFYYRKFEKRIFDGLDAPSNGNTDWNFVLWAVRKEHWTLVSDWLVSITLTYAELGEVAGIGQQEFDVVDPLAADRSAVYHDGLPRIRVAAFGLNGSRFRAYLRTDASPLQVRPRLAFDNAAADMKVFASALYGGNNPIDAKAAFRRQQLKDED